MPLNAERMMVTSVVTPENSGVGMYLAAAALRSSQTRVKPTKSALRAVRRGQNHLAYLNLTWAQILLRAASSGFSMPRDYTRDKSWVELLTCNSP